MLLALAAGLACMPPIEIANKCPSANGGPDLVVGVGKTVELSASESSDPNEDALTYSWTLVTKPAESQDVPVASETASFAFKPDSSGTYIYTLITSDGKCQSSEDVVTLTALRASAADSPYQCSEETLALYHFDEEGTSIAEDACGNGRHASVRGPTQGREGKFGKAYAFDGVDDVVVIPDDSSLRLDRFTLEAWIWPEAWPTGEAGIMERGDQGNSLALSVDAEGRASMRMTLEGSAARATSQRALVLDAWQHVAGAFDGSRLSVFAGGVKEGEATVSAERVPVEGELRMGGGAVGSAAFRGRIDEVRISGVGLSASAFNVDGVPPDTTLSLASDGAKAAASFGCDETNCTFECSLDSGEWQKCATPVELVGLAQGQHQFSVRASDEAGNVDASPAVYKWEIATSPVTPPPVTDSNAPGQAPDTTLTSTPSNPTSSSSASFSFSSPSGGVTFECSLDSQAWQSCSSPHNLSSLATGSHSFRVRAVGAGLAADPTPAEHTWYVDTQPPTFAGASSAVATGADRVKVSWSAAMDNLTAGSAIVYEVCRSTTSGACASAFSASYTTTDGASQYEATGLSGGSTYYFVARSKDQLANRDSNAVEVSARTWLSSCNGKSFECCSAEAFDCMVAIPQGAFVQGAKSGEGSSDENPRRLVTLSDYYMEKYEVTNSFYQVCVNAGGCTVPSQTKSMTRALYYGNSTYNHYPVMYVTWSQAVQYCQWKGRRLPSEAEWEKAARGPADGSLVGLSSGQCSSADASGSGTDMNCNRRPFPWGGAPTQSSPYGNGAACMYLNYDQYYENGNVTSYCLGVADTFAVHLLGVPPQEIAAGAGASPYGALHMVGNVAEWVQDWHQWDYYTVAPGTDPPGPADGGAGAARVTRGGSWSSNSFITRVSARSSMDPATSSDKTGFRCARSP